MPAQVVHLHEPPNADLTVGQSLWPYAVEDSRFFFWDHNVTESGFEQHTAVLQPQHTAHASLDEEAEIRLNLNIFCRQFLSVRL